jgi:hypothetical protein
MPRYHVKGHVGFQNGLIAGTQAGGVFTPVRRIVEPHGIADARLLLQPESGDVFAPDQLHLFGTHIRFDGLQGEIEPFHRVRGQFHQFGRRIFPQIGRACDGAVVAMPAGGQLQVDHLLIS